MYFESAFSNSLAFFSSIIPLSTNRKITALYGSAKISIKIITPSTSSFSFESPNILNCSITLASGISNRPANAFASRSSCEVASSSAVLESNKEPPVIVLVLISSAGNFYNALGWSFARGKGRDIHTYEKEEQIFSSCGGAAIYRRKLFEKIGYFDEEHFAYLEDTDIGYRARIYGYENWYAPKAIVYHVGSGTSGSRYNHFKTRYSSRNNVYLIYKNMPLLQIILNLPFLAAGFLIKFLFFAVKGMGKEYLAGIKNGFSISRKGRKVPFSMKHLPNYARIQLELWKNIFVRFTA